MTPPVSATPDESASELTISTAPLSFPPEFCDSCHFQALRAYTWCHSYFYILSFGVRCVFTARRQFFGERCPRFLPQVQELFFDFECFRLALCVWWAVWSGCSGCSLEFSGLSSIESYLVSVTLGSERCLGENWIDFFPLQLIFSLFSFRMFPLCSKHWNLTW